MTVPSSALTSPEHGLSAIATGLTTSSAPNSPSLDPSDSSAFTRRRTSWGNREDAGQDPLRFNMSHSPSAGPSTSFAHLNRINIDDPRRVYSLNDDPFYPPADDPYAVHPFPPLTPDARYPTLASTSSSTYPTGQEAYPSTTLVSSGFDYYDPEGRSFDDQARLTTHMETHGLEQAWQSDGQFDTDTERAAGARSKSRLKGKYSTGPSALKKTGTVLKTVSQRLRRVSLRVVNLAGTGVEQIRLSDDAQEQGKDGASTEDGEIIPDLRRNLPIRGRTLCILGPTNRLRLAFYNLLLYPWTEPAILLLIIVNTVVLIIQSSHSAIYDSSSPIPTVRGYFRTWENYALFVLFIIFSVEAFARICVSGFLLDPEISVSSLFTSPFASSRDVPTNSSTVSITTPGVHRQPSTVSQRSVYKGLTFSQTLTRIQEHFRGFFALHVGDSSVWFGERPPLATDRSVSNASTRTAISEKTATTSPKSSRVPPARPARLDSSRSDLISLPFKLSVFHANDKTQRNVPYLRHSWSRVDFVAIVSFWISFGLATGGIERGRKHIGIFRAMSVLRTARLLTITSGTTTIVQSLKTARPLLTSVAFFVLFAMVLFSIIGIQTFNGSLRRTCVLEPTLGEGEVQLGGQFCAGHIDPQTLSPTGFISISNTTSSSKKGYVCPLGQICREQDNPLGGIQSFDTIYQSALQVIIIASANGWSKLMYSIIDSEFFVASLFFIVCIIVLNFWLINLFVAVITNTFSAIRAQTNKSAFGAAPLAPVVDEQDDGWQVTETRPVLKSNWFKAISKPMNWCFVALALVSLVIQATRQVDMSPTRQNILDVSELAITIVFDVEIIVRLFAELPDWRAFFQGRNLIDLVLAIGSSIIQIPVIHRSPVYPWLTIFQLARFYRVILVIPRMRPLLLAVFGNMYGLANMTLFLLLVNFIAALVGVQLLRGDLDDTKFINFAHLFNAFLGMYQVFTSENWTDVLYNTGQAEIALGQTVVVLIFVASWYLFANFIILQMFIAVINENFDVADELKKNKQAANFWITHQPQEAKAPWLRRLNPYRWVRANPVKVKVDNLPPSLVLPIRQDLIQNYNIPQATNLVASEDVTVDRVQRGPRHYSTKSLTMLQRLFAGDVKSDDVPLTTLRHNRGDTIVSNSAPDEETERYLDVLPAPQLEGVASEDVADALYEDRARKADFISDHPTYDKPFWLISRENQLRRLCQKLVRPANGERIFGIPPSPIASTLFQLILLLAVVGGIAVEGIATPVYRRTYYLKHGTFQRGWFDIAEAVFGFTLLVEFLIKILADGFLWTPNAYLRSIWNVLDLFILVGLLVNTTISLIFISGLSRFTRALKALRALRLITLIDRMRTTFESLLISGAARIFDAALLALLYMIPYAVWGLNIFNGRMRLCNDSGSRGASDCINEYTNTVFGNSFGFLAPRVWDNPSPSTSFSFDSFRASLLILFEIVSLEGWIDVMAVATSITGRGQQPKSHASQENAIFFLIYNLLGGVVIFTLFVSIIVSNFRSKTGAAFLTQPQREWIDLQKLLKRQKPSKRPLERPSTPLKAWCYERAVHKHGWWTRAMTVVFLIHIIALMTQTFVKLDTSRNDFFLFVAFVYIIDTLVRFYGLGWRSFHDNGWNVFDIVVSIGSFITTIVVRFGRAGFVIQQLQKLFLVSIAFKLIQRTNSLNKLFKTAVASLPIIISLLSLWFILFLFFAILFMEVFSLTKWNSAETRDQNYSALGSSLVMLAFMTTGEAWNQYMHDFALVYPRCTNLGSSEVESDCGSVGWAFGLFIAWNLLSEYIFVNMFTGVVVENFSYVFQATRGVNSITRDEIRAFKKVWAQFANKKTGCLERDKLAPFFAKLSGVFEVRIYPSEFSVRSMISLCRENSTSSHSSRNVVEGVNIAKLKDIVNRIDSSSIQKRRSIYSKLFYEASSSNVSGRGITFTEMLIMLAHYKIIVDREALVLKDLVVRTETNKIINDLVNLDRVRSLLKRIALRRRFLARWESAMMKMDHPDIPAIVVEAETVSPPGTPGTPGTPGALGATPSSDSLGSLELPPPPKSPNRPSFPIRDVSLAADLTSGLHRSRRTSDMSVLSADFGYRVSRDLSTSMEENAQDVLSSLENSVWRDLIQQVAEEEEDS